MRRLRMYGSVLSTRDSLVSQPVHVMPVTLRTMCWGLVRGPFSRSGVLLLREVVTISSTRAVGLVLVLQHSEAEMELLMQQLSVLGGGEGEQQSSLQLEPSLPQQSSSQLGVSVSQHPSERLSWGEHCISSVDVTISVQQDALHVVAGWVVFEEGMEALFGPQQASFVVGVSVVELVVSPNSVFGLQLVRWTDVEQQNSLQSASSSTLLSRVGGNR
jgi:hypothetical protein